MGGNLHSLGSDSPFLNAAPNISVVIPVYNVEPYLRQCLDSVVNQTMPDIQIICVNDGSTDGSRAILQEYADRDSRIEIIDKPNGGLSSARNAAYPYIQGKYTLFVDSDDWIELDLCGKTYRKAEETGAQISVFFYQREGKDDAGNMCRRITSDDKMTVEEKLPILDYPSTWGKLWNTRFLLDNKLDFPEGLVFEDNLHNWQSVTLADKISVVPERLYHYRYTPGSITETQGKHLFHMIPIYNKIQEYLLESGYYRLYREQFISLKLTIYRRHYRGLLDSLKPTFEAMIRENITDEDREFYRSGKVKRRIARFYKMVIDGSPFERGVYQTFAAIRQFLCPKKK